MAPDLERRFGGLRRLYGDAGYARVRAARIAVIGVGGVGSWAAEALARCGVAALTLIDMIKSVDKGAVITDVRLEAKDGGKSGPWRRS